MPSDYISTDQIIAEASSIIKTFSEQEKALARQWCYTATRRIGFNRLDKKTSNQIPLVDFSAEKPSDLANTIDIALFDSTDREIVTRFKGRSQQETEGSLARTHQDARQVAYALQVTEDDTYFNVEEFEDDSIADAYFVVTYYAYPVDIEGYPKVPEIYTLAVIMYIRYMWTLRERASLGEIQEARNTWLREAAAAYGRIKTPSMLEGKEIARGLNSMIQKTVVRDRQF